LGVPALINGSKLYDVLDVFKRLENLLLLVEEPGEVLFDLGLGIDHRRSSVLTDPS
jgi:hypothetical protein